MKKLWTTLIFVLLLAIVLAGCINTEATDDIDTDQVNQETFEENNDTEVSADCEYYDPDVHGKFVGGAIIEVDRNNGTVLIEDFESTLYTVQLAETTNFVFTSLDELAEGQSVTVRAENFDEGITTIQALELQLEQEIDPDDITEISALQ
ncbi:hypothetical protein [Vallitalea okinawensis]|uniref:hypothetical protein n=1 Tax=Vallitalea okinawensis TaxID=2078660 RepID=UPI000CFB70A7|nr:hypothetical protein [Vallitalea okinawensis]